MFRTLKYLLLANLYKKAKNSFVMLFVYTVLLILFTFIINDILSVSTGSMVYVVLLTKWVVIFSLLALIGFSVLKIFNVASKPFDKGENSKSETAYKDTKKEKILSKEKLSTTTDLIMKKYTKEHSC